MVQGSAQYDLCEKSNLISKLMDGHLNRDGDQGEADRAGMAYTMVTERNLLHLVDVVHEVLDSGIEGDFIECGVWRGGCCILMRLLLGHQYYPRKVWVADSFQGIPKPDKRRYPRDIKSNHWKDRFLIASLNEVKDNFIKFGCLDERTVFLPGFFKDTMKTVPEEQKFSIIRLDGDLYGSTIICLEHLFPKLSDGGFLIVDDFKKDSVEQACRDYYASNGMTFEPIFSDYMCSWWRK